MPRTLRTTIIGGSNTVMEPGYLGQMLAAAERQGLRLDVVENMAVGGTTNTYGLFRLAGIVQQIYYRFYHGQTQDKRFAQFIHMNKLLEQMSLQVIQKSSL